MPTIKSSTDLRNGYNAISTFCHESREPVFITKNGQGDLAVMSIELYEEITQNRVMNLEETIRELLSLPASGVIPMDLPKPNPPPKPVNRNLAPYTTPEEKKAAMEELRELMSGIDGSDIDIKQLRAERREARYNRERSS